MSAAQPYPPHTADRSEDQPGPGQPGRAGSRGARHVHQPGRRRQRGTVRHAEPRCLGRRRPGRGRRQPASGGRGVRPRRRPADLDAPGPRPGRGLRACLAARGPGAAAPGETRSSPTCRAWPWWSWSPTASRCCSPTRRPGWSAPRTRAGRVWRPGWSPSWSPRWRAQGADPARMTAAIGPHICGGCYEVPARACGTGWRPGSPTRPASPGRAPPASTSGPGSGRSWPGRECARSARDPRCTPESPELYSYRRDGATGRFAGLVWLAP